MVWPSTSPGMVRQKFECGLSTLQRRKKAHIPCSLLPRNADSKQPTGMKLTFPIRTLRRWMEKDRCSDEVGMWRHLYQDHKSLQIAMTSAATMRKCSLKKRRRKRRKGRNERRRKRRRLEGSKTREKRGRKSSKPKQGRGGIWGCQWSFWPSF